MTIKSKYRNFLREKVINNRFGETDSVTVLGDNFIDEYYIGVFQIREDYSKLWRNFEW